MAELQRQSGDRYDEEDAMTILLESNILMPYAAESWVHDGRIAFTDIVYDPGTCLATADKETDDT